MDCEDETILMIAFSEWEEMETDVTDLEELSAETAFITEDMLQSITTGGQPAVTNGNLNDTLSNQRCRLVFGSSASLRDVLIAQQHHSTCVGKHGAADNETNGNLMVANDNEAFDLFTNGKTVTHSNRSSVASNHSNNMFYELQTLQSEQNGHSQCSGRDQSFVYENSGISLPQDTPTTQIYENVPVVIGNQRTIEVRGVTNTSSSDSCIYGNGNHGNRESDVSLPSDLSGAAIETESCLTDNSGAAGGGGENSQADHNPPSELNDILFRFDRQFRVNTGFGFANWRWSHRLSNQSANSGGGAGGGGGGFTTVSPENNLQKQARWLRRLHVHQSTATPTNSNSNSLRSNSNSNSLRSNSSGSSSGVRNLQQEWYFYDPRLVPQHRTQRLAVQTDHNRIRTTSYVSNIVTPPTYEELTNIPAPGLPGSPPGLSGSTPHIGASAAVLPNLPEHPPPFEETLIMQPLISPDTVALPSEPPPPYVDAAERPPVYDLDPSALIDPPPFYDDHSFSGDELAVDPMDPAPVSQGEDDNFILTPPTTVTSETDRNFILSAVPPNLRSANRQGVSIAPDDTSTMSSENESDVTTNDSDVIARDNVGHSDLDFDNLSQIERNSEAASQRAGDNGCLMDMSRQRHLPLEELFRQPNASDDDRNSDDLGLDIDIDLEQVTDESELSNDDENQAIADQLPRQRPRHPSSSIFPGYQLLHNSPELPPWSRLGHMTDPLANQADDNLDDVTDDLVDDLPDQYQDSSRSIANFSSDDYPAGFVSGNRPPLRWSRGMGLGRWNAQNWAI